MSEVIITEKNFEKEVLQSKEPVLVDFWAAWCGPCRMLAPLVSQVAEENQGSLKVGKVNVDEAQSLAAHFSIRNIPTLILFKDGRPVNQSVGVVDKQSIEKFCGLK